MKIDKEIDPKIIKELLDHPYGDGRLFWRFRERKWFANDKAFATWNGKWAGKQGFTSTTLNGYRQGRIFSRQYYAHRVIWCIYYGEWPPNQIDHINGVRTDNSIGNLRLAVNSQNGRNRGKQSNNTSGYKGVSYYKSRGVWEANIQADGVKRRIGYFKTAEDAHQAYCERSKIIHGQFSRTE